MTNFFLIPFPDNLPCPNIELKGKIERINQQLFITFELTGEIEKIAIAPPDNYPSRRNQLWQETCFEFFLGLKESPCYWEFNLSPAGYWNIYFFDDYRQNIIEELAFQELPFEIKIQSNSLILSLTLDLEAIINSKEELEVGITTVIKNKINEADSITYWALEHRAREADFHQRKSFIISL